MSIGCYKFAVEAKNDGTTLKTFLRQECGLSARSLTVLKYAGGRITADGKELRAHDILYQGEIICVTLPNEHNDIPPVTGRPDVLYEDEYLLIVNKPAFMPVHPTKKHQHDTLANIVAFYQHSRGEDYIFRALNRLDKDTSGCVVIAKDRIAYSLVKPTIQKTYIAVCEGDVRQGGTIQEPIALAADSKIKRCVSDEGAVAITHYRPLRHFGKHTLCELCLETGRTHQIRCHMSYIGYPLAGDDLYGGSTDRINRQALHCQTVELLHPITLKKIILTTEIPKEFLAI